MQTRFSRILKNSLVAGVSGFVILALAGFLVGPPSAAFATSLSRSVGNDVVYGRVTDSNGQGEFHFPVILYKDVNGKKVIYAVNYTNHLGDYRIPKALGTGTYFVQFNNENSTVHGARGFHLVKGHDYRVSARWTSSSGFLFYLPIFTY
jgi:hypothetical protein